MTKLLPIQLTAQQGSWQKFHARKSNKRFLSIQKKVFARDHHTCRYCGFRSERFQEVVNIDHDYNNNKANNLATACPFCAQCLFLDGIEMDEHFGGHVIYLPEIAQADLNNFCRVIFSVLGKQSPYKSHLQAVYLSLKDRAEVVDNAYGPESSTPMVFGQALMDCGVPPDQMNQIPIDALRLLPSRRPFKETIEYWNSAIYSRFPL